MPISVIYEQRIDVPSLSIADAAIDDQRARRPPRVITDAAKRRVPVIPISSRMAAAFTDDVIDAFSAIDDLGKMRVDAGEIRSRPCRAEAAPDFALTRSSRRQVLRKDDVA